MTSGGIIFINRKSNYKEFFPLIQPISSKQHRATRRNNSLHPGYLASLVTRTNHNTIQTIGIYVRVFRTDYHAVQIFIPHWLLTQATDEARETSFIFQRLSVTIQRFDAV